MTPLDTFLKDPNAILPYGVDWSAWMPDGDSAASAAWTATAGITVVSSSLATDVATVIISGGTAGTDYDVTCRVTTTNGLVDDRTIRIRVRER